MTNQILITPRNSEDAERWRLTRLRRRMQEDVWGEDVARRLRQRMSLRRTEQVGLPNTSLNFYSSVVQQLAIQYDTPPTVTNPAFDSADVAALWDIVSEDSHIWEMASTNSEYVIGLRENLVKINRTPNGVRLVLITPDTVTIKTAPNDPNDITEVSEAVYYSVQGKSVPAWNVWSIADPENPFFMVRNLDGMDITEMVMPGGYEWADYYADGTPYLPYVRYRARWTATQWDYKSWTTLVEATLDVAALWTAWNKSVFDSSWAQKYVIDLVLQGTSTVGEGVTSTSTVDADRSSILMFKSTNDKTGTVGTFQKPDDVNALSQSIMAFQNSVMSNIGIHPADIQASSQPQSGISLAIKKSSQRRMAKSYLPQFRAGDLELMGKIAATTNDLSSEGSPLLPETGYTIEYHLPEESQEDEMAELDRDLKLVSAGLESMVDIYLRRKPGISREQALADLIRNQTENNILTSGASNA